MAQVRRHVRIPIATGERLYTKFPFFELIKARGGRRPPAGPLQRRGHHRAEEDRRHRRGPAPHHGPPQHQQPHRHRGQLPPRRVPAQLPDPGVPRRVLRAVVLRPLPRAAPAQRAPRPPARRARGWASPWTRPSPGPTPWSPAGAGASVGSDPGAVLFDLDGTLVDSFLGIAATVDAVLERFGHAPCDRDAAGDDRGPPRGHLRRPRPRPPASAGAGYVAAYLQLFPGWASRPPPSSPASWRPSTPAATPDCAWPWSPPSAPGSPRPCSTPAAPGPTSTPSSARTPPRAPSLIPLRPSWPCSAWACPSLSSGAGAGSVCRGHRVRPRDGPRRRRAAPSGWAGATGLRTSSAPPAPWPSPIPHGRCWPCSCTRGRSAAA